METCFYIAQNWLTEMLNPFNIFSSRKGKAAECFNFCRGLKFKCKNHGKYFTRIAVKKPLALRLVIYPNHSNFIPA